MTHKREDLVPYWDSPYNHNSRQDFPGPDVLDPIHGVLFCSMPCALAAQSGEELEVGGTMRTSAPHEFEEIDPDDYDQTKYGALCPFCGLEYHSFG